MDPHVIPVFCDFACPWSYSARQRHVRMEREMPGLQIVLMPWEIDPGRPAGGEPNEHRTIGEKLARFASESGVRLKDREWAHNTRRALRGTFYARAVGAEADYVD